MTHPVIWFEVLGKDAGKLRKFYGDLFGWTFQVIPQSNYGLVTTGDTRGIPGGVGSAEANMRSWVTFYAETADVTASLKQAETLGGKIVVPRTAMPDVTFGIFEDPEGHPIGLVEAKATAAQ